MAGPYYASRSSGGGVVCGCPPCSVGKFGESYDFDTSGISVCACDEGPPARRFLSVMMPTNFSMVHAGDFPTTWFSTLSGSAELWEGSDCGSLTFSESGQFRATGICTEFGLAQILRWVGDGGIRTFGVYGATFTALGQSQPNNRIACEFDSYFVGGDGTITAP